MGRNIYKQIQCQSRLKIPSVGMESMCQTEENIRITITARITDA
jgi:hypothetical protein